MTSAESRRILTKPDRTFGGTLFYPVANPLTIHEEIRAAMSAAHITLELTQEEHAAIAAAAQVTGVSVEEFVLQAARARMSWIKIPPAVGGTGYISDPQAEGNAK